MGRVRLKVGKVWVRMGVRVRLGWGWVRQSLRFGWEECGYSGGRVRLKAGV